MLRVTVGQTSENATTFVVEGRIAGAGAAELWRVCEEALAEGRAVALDLAAVTFIERPALAVFHELTQRGVRCVKCSPFLSEQLKSAACRPPLRFT